MINVDAKEIRQMEKDLEVFAKQALPYATRHTLNQLAWRGRQYAQANIDREFIERNKWTRGSVRVQQTKSLNMERQASAVGSTEDYMARQEFGEVISAEGQHGHPIPTGAAAGQKGKVPRTRVPQRKNRMRNIRLGGKKVRPKTEPQRLLLLVREAIESGRRVFFWPGRDVPREGIYRVKGGSLRRHRGWPRGAKLELMYDLSHDVVTIRATPWLRPAANKAERDAFDLYAKALQFQMDRNNLMRERS